MWRLFFLLGFFDGLLGGNHKMMKGREFKKSMQPLLERVTSKPIWYYAGREIINNLGPHDPLSLLELVQKQATPIKNDGEGDVGVLIKKELLLRKVRKINIFVRF